MKRYLAKSRNEDDLSIARETLEKAAIAEVYEFAKRINLRER